MTTAAMPPSQESDVGPHYLVQFIDLEGNVIRMERLTAATDEEALALASAMANGHAIELWDGLRFLEHFDSAST